MEKEVLNLILVEVREMKGDMAEVKNRLGNLENDMSEVKGRLTNLETDMSEVKGRLTNLETDMSGVKERMTNVENDLSDVKTDLSDVKIDLSNVKDLAEFNKETSESIKNVVTSHYMEFKKYVKSNNTQHNVYNAKLLQYNKEK